MRRKVMSLVLVVCSSMAISTTGCAARLAEMTAAERISQLELERVRLTRRADPVDRTKTYISMSRLLLTFASDAIRDADTDALKTSVDQYTVVLKAAAETMLNSDRDAGRRPGGYKELEIAVRGQLRMLDDLRSQLTFDERAPIDEAITVATEIRDEILARLFPVSS